MVSFVCSGSTYIGEVVLGGNNGPALLVKREGVQTPVCQVDCVPASSLQTGSHWAKVAAAVEADSRKRNRQAGHALTGPGIWGMGGPHTVFRAFIAYHYEPSDSNTLHQMKEAADAYIKDNNLCEQGWFTAFGQSRSRVTIARLSPLGDTPDRAICVNSDMSWSLVALQREARKTALLRHPPKKLHPSLLGPLIVNLSKCRLCPGNSDTKFREVTDVYKDQALLSANTNQSSARVEEEPFVPAEGHEPITFTIRACPCDNHQGCDMLLLEEGRVRCLACDRTRATLRARQSDLRKGKLPSAKPGDKTDLTGHQTERYSHQVLRNSLAFQQAVLKHHQKEAERLRNKSVLLGERPLSKRSQEEMEAVFKWCEDNKLIPPQYLDADQQVFNPLRELWDYQRAKQENKKNKALELGLTCWVRNRRDGQVEVTAEGYEEDLQQLLRWLHTDSPMADVSGVESSWSAATGQFDSFDKLWTE